MLMFVLESNDETSSIKAPPLLHPISHELLQSSCSTLSDLALAHFKDHLSPFIRKDHLSLSTLNEEMNLDYPVFVYFHNENKKSENEFISIILCSIKPINQEKKLKRKYQLNNSVVVITENKLVEPKVHKERIIKKSQMQVLNKLLNASPKTTQVLIKGKEIKLIPQKFFQNEVEYRMNWAELLSQKWGKFQSENESIYVLVRDIEFT